MTLLVISPDYASHLYPMATLATAWRAAGERVVVATGPATDSIVGGFGFERENLQLGRGSNPGVIKAEDQPPGEDDALRGFFDATRRGAVETLAFQAGARGDDLLWNPVGVAREVRRVVDLVRPDDVIVDHLAFGARLALVVAGVRHADVVLGHPSALVVGDEVYGYPPAWPRRFRPDPDALASLHRLCVGVRDSFTAQWNDALAVLDPGARASADAFAETGDVPVVYVSLGSFLSVRSDVLARVAEALRGLDVRVALASGSTRRVELGPVPKSTPGSTGSAPRCGRRRGPRSRAARSARADDPAIPAGYGAVVAAGRTVWPPSHRSHIRGTGGAGGRPVAGIA